MNCTEAKRQQFAELLGPVDLAAWIGPLTAERLMTADPTCVAPQQTALELVQLFHEKQFRHLLVTGPAGNLVGVISDRDVLRCFGVGDSPDRGALEGITAADLMSTDLITIRRETLAADAIRLMVDHGINCLPVVTEGVPVGILTTTDWYVLLEQLLQPHPAPTSTPSSR